MIRKLLCNLFALVPREEASERAFELRSKLGVARGALYSIKFNSDFTEEELDSAIEQSMDSQCRFAWEKC